MILVVAEQRSGKLNRATWETIAGAQQLAGAASLPITIAVPGTGVQGVAGELAAADVAEVVTVEHPALEPYTPDGFTAALQDLVAKLSPTYVLLPHTYQTRDFAPKLAARMDRALITDVTAIKSGGETAFVRPMFQGKLTADVVPQGPAPHFVTFQIGAYRADQAAHRPLPSAP
jgi:electron transfer flavoprotein alpha subunit